MNTPKRILVVEDDPVSCRRLTAILARLGHAVTVCRDGQEAWEAFLAEPYQLLITDWVMPRVDGLELCRRVRARQGEGGDYVYTILVTSAERGLVEGLEAGADDFIFKPVRADELRVRLQAGERVLALEAALQRRVRELEAALAQVRRLEGLLPICSYCKKIRERDGWTSLEQYVTRESEAYFSHSICPSCYAHEVVPQLEQLEREAPTGPATRP